MASTVRAPFDIVSRQMVGRRSPVRGTLPSYGGPCSSRNEPQGPRSRFDWRSVLVADDDTALVRLDVPSAAFEPRGGPAELRSRSK